MKKIILLFVLTVFLVSCNKQPSDYNITKEEPTQPILQNSEHSDSPTDDNITSEEPTEPILDNSDSQLESKDEDEIHPIVEILFSGNSEILTFDDIIKNISNDDMNWELIYESRTDAKISKEDDVYYAVNPNPFGNDIRISPLDTFTEILNRCEYIETEPLNEPVIYTFIFHALDINGVENEICVYVTRSCVKFAYNGISDDKEYVNMYKPDDYKNVCYGYDSFIWGIIPDENGQLATIW